MVLVIFVVYIILTLLHVHLSIHLSHIEMFIDLRKDILVFMNILQ